MSQVSGDSGVVAPKTGTSNDWHTGTRNYDTAGNRLSKTTGTCSAGTTTNHSYNSFSQLTNTGYLYDALGRNTVIPAADAPNSNGAITLTYNTNDQVTGILQAGNSTSFTYDAEGRRLNETSAGATTTRHYTDSSDNPTWTTQTGSNAKTEIYTPSLGTGLNVTTTIQAGVATGSMQLHDLRGNTVTTINLTNNTATAWCSYDEYGNPDPSNPANTANINHTTYGQAERATNTTGLILMGARVYNPETNQFTSPDPVKGGNENGYVYPNDPINGSDSAGEYGSKGDPWNPLPEDEIHRIIAAINQNIGKAILQNVTNNFNQLAQVTKFFISQGGPKGQVSIHTGGPQRLHIKVHDRDGKLLRQVRIEKKSSKYSIPNAFVFNFQSGSKKTANDSHILYSQPQGSLSGYFEDVAEDGSIYGTH